MLLTIADLNECIAGDLDALIAELEESTGHRGAAERAAWRASLPAISEALVEPALAQMHVHFERRAYHAALEYKLPGTSSRCDLVLLGQRRSKGAAVIIELKDWATNGDRAGLIEGEVVHRGEWTLHPSDQVRGYVQYCQAFHSAVVGNRADVSGCVVMTRARDLRAYRERPNDSLATLHPLFSLSRSDLLEGLTPFLLNKLEAPDAEFATRFAAGTYRQDRRLMAQVGSALSKDPRGHFELLDNQRHAFNLCMAHVRAAVDVADSSKHVIIVDGPPGSGKSAVAAKVLAQLLTDETVRDGNIALVTTSQSQSSTWRSIIDRATARRDGSGVARKATSFTPIDIAQLSTLRKGVGNPALFKDGKSWRAHMSELRALKVPFRAGAEDDACLLTLIDEAHALINTEAEHGVGQYGFVTGLGPQAWHLIRCSRVCVFLLDEAQGFRLRENTRIVDIERWAKELGAQVERVSLRGAQFRCAGSVEYVDWIEGLLDGQEHLLLADRATTWRERESSGTPRAAEPSMNKHRQRLSFEVFDNPFTLEEELRLKGTNSIRLLSTYSRPWNTREVTRPHGLPPERLDFNESIAVGNGSIRSWSRPWNVVPADDYALWVLGDVPSSEMHSDPLSEVGCPYVVRGFEYDYVGILWLDDLLWRNDRWVVALDNVHESGIEREVKRARKEGPIAPVGVHGTNVLERVKQAYRILFSRALKGVLLWAADKETRAHLRQCLGPLDDQ